MADFGCFGWRHRGPENEVNPPLGGGIWDGYYWIDEDAVIDEELRLDLRAWHARFELGNSGSDEHCFKFDWKSFHSEGVAFCCRLNAAFGSTVRIRYEKPVEDPTHRGRSPAQIEADGRVVEVPWDHDLERQTLDRFVEDVRRHPENGRFATSLFLVASKLQ
ncbi:hypothetical protein [Ruegeria sp. HKCCD7255]|uniref:hypothetical protein n=1 Tax=Ruegeria sp. HKCCD7255 TaxID=2683004 RepID=UPI001487A84E|nr:hypothetical protein [Ruegeria sp. HKCCD7255]